MERGQYDAAAVTLDSAAYYEVIDGNIPANIIIILRDRSKLANARGHYAEALAYADSSLQMSAGTDDARPTTVNNSTCSASALRWPSYSSASSARALTSTSR